MVTIAIDFDRSVELPDSPLKPMSKRGASRLRSRRHRTRGHRHNVRHVRHARARQLALGTAANVEMIEALTDISSRMFKSRTRRARRAARALREQVLSQGREGFDPKIVENELRQQARAVLAMLKDPLGREEHLGVLEEDDEIGREAALAIEEIEAEIAYAYASAA